MADDPTAHTVADTSAAPPCGLTQILSRTGASDLFVLRRVGGDRFMHIGGAGRGTGWAGIVDLVVTEEPHVSVALTAAEPVRVRGGGPVHVFGPYYARDALLIRVNHDVVVVIGSAQGGLDEGGLSHAMECAGQAEQLISEVSPAKRLADELEVLHAVKATMQVPSPRLDDVAHHVCATAASALSCEVAILYLMQDDKIVIHGPVGGFGHAGAAAAAVRPLMVRLAAIASAGSPSCQQQATRRPLSSPLSPSDGVASYFVLPVGDGDVRGILLLCHLNSAARGFTSLCQDLGARLAEAADTVLQAAQLREQLQVQLVAITDDACRDPLTGLYNRREFDAALARAEVRRRAGRQTGVIVADVNGLKQANDTRGHGFGDRLIRATAAILTSVVGEQGVVARLGGDEFAVLLEDPSSVARVMADIALALHRAPVICDPPDMEPYVLSAALGLAISSDAHDVGEAVRRADKNMYTAKLQSGRATLTLDRSFLNRTGLPRPLV